MVERRLGSRGSAVRRLTIILGRGMALGRRWGIQRRSTLLRILGSFNISWIRISLFYTIDGTAFTTVRGCVHCMLFTL